MARHKMIYTNRKMSVEEISPLIDANPAPFSLYCHRREVGNAIKTIGTRNIARIHNAGEHYYIYFKMCLTFDLTYGNLTIKKFY